MAAAVLEAPVAPMIPAAKAVKGAPAPRPPKGVMVKGIPRFVAPQLAKLVDAPSTQPGWAHEVKFDGYRAQLRVSGGEATNEDRGGHGRAPRRLDAAHHRGPQGARYPCPTTETNAARASTLTPAYDHVSKGV